MTTQSECVVTVAVQLAACSFPFAAPYLDRVTHVCSLCKISVRVAKAGLDDDSVLVTALPAHIINSRSGASSSAGILGSVFVLQDAQLEDLTVWETVSTSMKFILDEGVDAGRLAKELCFWCDIFGGLARPHIR